MNVRVDALKKQARRRSTERHIAAVATLFIFPAIIGIFGAGTADAVTYFGLNLVIFVWSAVVIVFCLFFWRWNPTGEDVVGLAVSHENLENEVSECEKRIEKYARSINLLTIQANYSISSRNTIVTHVKAGMPDRAALEKAINDLADPLIAQGEEIFGLGSGERWSFAVYLYSKKSATLISVWRDRARCHPSRGMGRAWAAGEGHVGKSFTDQIPYITGDARSEEARQFSTAPPLKIEPYDRDTYISFAAIPIGPILNQDTRPYGVLVGTSDRVGRFDRENSGILVQIAISIASLLITGNFDIDLLTAEQHDAE